MIDADVPSITAWTLDGAEYQEADRAEGARALDLTDPFPVSIVPQTLVDAHGDDVTDTTGSSPATRHHRW